MLSFARLSPMLALLLVLLPLSALAQFNFFNQQHQHQQQQHHQQQQQQQQQDGTRVRGWQAQKEIPCNQYLCPNTFACVEFPSQCPCPYQEDKKCFLPLVPGESQHDEPFVCVRGGAKGCEDVKRRAMGKW